MKKNIGTVEESNMGVEKAESDQKLRYRDSGIDERIIRAVEEMGYDNMTPIQEEAIPVFLSGRDVIGQAQTGTGKTAAFGIPILHKINPNNKNLQAIILCPTRELAIQAADELRKFSKYMHGVKVLPIYGGQDISRQITVVLDEADEMLNMGFREDIETILKEVPDERQTGLFSATMPAPILDITKMYQKDAVFLKMTPKEITIPLIKQAYYLVQHKNKEEILCRLMDYYDPARALIFCNTKRMVDELTENLKKRGYAVEGLHGDLSQHQRDTVMNLFKSGNAAVLIATDVAARGIDVDNVEAVFNYDVPEDIEYYVHRIGRTGRAGKTGRSFTLATNRDMRKLRDIERICHTRIKERKVPAATDITAKKADKILRETEEVITGQDISKAMKFIEERAALTEYDVLQYAAAFMKMKLGDDIEDIKPERSRSEWLPRGRKGRSGERADAGRDRSGRDRFDREKSGKDKSGKGKFGRDKSDRNRSGKDKFGKDKFDKDNFSKDKSGKGKSDKKKQDRAYDRREADMNSRYAALRIKTKKQK